MNIDTIVFKKSHASRIMQVTDSEANNSRPETAAVRAVALRREHQTKTPVRTVS